MRLTSNLRLEDGAVTVMVAIVVALLFGMTALSVDVFRMYEEKRQLQTAADASALSGAQQLRISATSAEATAKEFIKQNPSTHHLLGWYTGDDAAAPKPCDPKDTTTTYDCVKVIQRSTACDPNGVVAYDCVISQVVAPPKSQNAAGFDFLFARVFGFTERAVRARATAVLGAAAPGGERLVPWMVLDCPQPKYPGETAAVGALVESFSPSCAYPNGYPVSDDYANGERTLLFADSGGGQRGNFHGSAFEPEPNCPLWDGLFKGGGGADYEAFLAGYSSQGVIPCRIDTGSRVYSEDGFKAGPTNQGLCQRGVDTGGACKKNINPAAIDCDSITEFQKAVNVGTVGDGLVGIHDPKHPCLVVLLLTVKPDPVQSSEWDVNVSGGSRIVEWEHPDPLDISEGRFGRFGPGKKASLIRNFGLFYITQVGDNSKPYEGLFMRTVESGNNGLSGKPCEIDTAICVVKLVQ